MTAFPGLSSFNLTTPENVIIKTANLPAFSSPFYRNLTDVIHFEVPTAGENVASTKNSSYPRCELRETLLNGDKAAWPANSCDLHILTYELAVQDSGPAGKVIIGQIHGIGHKPPVKVQWNDTDKNGKGKVVVQCREYLAGTEQKHELLTDVPEGARISLSITLTRDCKLIVTGSVRGSGKVSTFSTQLNGRSYRDDRFYFKVGAYVQTEVGSAQGVGKVDLHALSLYHGEAAVPSTVEPEVVAPEPVPTPTPAPVVPAPAPTPKPEPALHPLEQRLTDLAVKVKAKTVTVAAAKTELNKIGDAIDGLPDGAFQTALYAFAKRVRALL